AANNDKLIHDAANPPHSSTRHRTRARESKAFRRASKSAPTYHVHFHTALVGDRSGGEIRGGSAKFRGGARPKPAMPRPFFPRLNRALDTHVPWWAQTMLLAAFAIVGWEFAGTMPSGTSGGELPAEVGWHWRFIRSISAEGSPVDSYLRSSHD